MKKTVMIIWENAVDLYSDIDLEMVLSFCGPEGRNRIFSGSYGIQTLLGATKYFLQCIFESATFERETDNQFPISQMSLLISQIVTHLARRSGIMCLKWSSSVTRTSNYVSVKSYEYYVVAWTSAVGTWTHSMFYMGSLGIPTMHFPIVTHHKRTFSFERTTRRHASLYLESHKYLHICIGMKSEWYQK